jgi:hypothetical protein
MTLKLEQEQFRAENNCYTLDPDDLLEAKRMADNNRVYKTAGITIDGTDDPACLNASDRATDFQAVVTGNLGGDTPADDIWAISSVISAPVHCDGRASYTADQTAACSGQSTTVMEY